MHENNNGTTPKSRFTELRSETVVLQPLTEDDITATYADWLNDPKVVRYSNQQFIRHSLESCRQYLDSFRNTDNMLLKISHGTPKTFVGTMSLYFQPHHQTVDIGIMIGHRPVWGRGIGQEAWNTILHWLLHQPDIRKITAGTMRCNLGMVAILRRSGMQCEAVRHAQELLDGTPQDLVHYSIFSRNETDLPK